MSLARPATTPRLRRLALPLLLLALVLLAGAVAAPPSRAADPVQITDGVLNWGVKASWRQYAKEPVVMAGGVTKRVDGTFAFPIESGTYDPATRTTTIQAKGTLQWQSHWYPSESSLYPPPAGWTGSLELFVLDVTITDPQLTIGPNGSQLTVEAISRKATTWELVDLGRVPLADLDPSAPTVSTTVAGGTTTWTGIPAALTAQGAGGVFGGNYAVGTIVDPVGFTYTGDGGAPDFSERWTAPDSTGLDPAVNGVWEPVMSGNGSLPLWVDADRGILHEQLQSTGDWRAFDLRAGTVLGAPSTPSAAARSYSFIDTTRGVRYFSSTGTTRIDRTLRWDVDAKAYVEAPLAAPFTVFAPVGMLWDTPRDRAIGITLVVPDGVSATDYEAQQWWLATYTRQSDGSFAEQRYRLPNGPAGWNQNWYVPPAATNTAAIPPVAVAPDGSIILTRSAVQSPQAGVTAAPLTEKRAQRIVLDAGTATVSEIPGTEIALADLVQRGFTSVFTSSDGHVSFVAPGFFTVPTGVLQYQLAGGALTKIGRLDVTQGRTTLVAGDPVNGTIWIEEPRAQKLSGVRDARLVYSKVLTTINTRLSALGVLPDHDVWYQSSDGTPATFVASTYGWARLHFTGFSPKATQQPAAASVSLTADEASEAVTFTAAATGTPAPTRRWQVKRPGTGRFTDIPGATGASLAVTAERGMGGSQYRAVFTNAAGELATDAATLAVAYAPRLTGTLADVTVTEGADAAFAVLPDGNPEPTVTWQRRIDGFWTAIDPDSDDFAIDGATLTVRATNVRQSGTQLRARLTSTAGTAYSRAATLTVHPAVEIPPEGLALAGVRLDWSGNAELQKAPPIGGSNFFSAGVSDGAQATYAASSGDVRILHVSASGTEAVATWATRADHVLDGGRQLVRLVDGRALIAPDGSATVRWSGAFSVNFYGGLVPFTVTGLRLIVAADGTGRLVGDLSGYASSISNPGEREPMTPVADVVIATFSGLHLDPAGRFTVTPDYAGVAVTVPAGTTPQDRTVAGWGAWPQAFVDFHVVSGLSSYWYSSGGAADPSKPPAPFVVDFSAATPPVDDPPETGGGGGGGGSGGGGGAAEPEDGQPTESEAASAAPDGSGAGATGPGAGSAGPGAATPGGSAGTPANAARVVTVASRAQRADRSRRIALATLSCPARTGCAVRAPSRVTVRIAGHRYTATVLAPATIAAGAQATLRVRLPAAALTALRGRTATVRVTLTVVVDGRRVTRTVKATIAG